MFYHHQLLTSRDSHFALVWRLASNGNLRSIQRNTLLQANVQEICDALINRIPPVKFTISGTKEKFSLYLLGRLAYGIVLLHQKQVSFLESDAKAAVLTLKSLPLDIKINISGSSKRRPAEERTPHKRRKIHHDLEKSSDSLPLANIDAVDKNILNADLEMITLAEPAFEWQEHSVFGNHELPPFSRNHVMMLNGLDDPAQLVQQHSSDNSDDIRHFQSLLASGSDEMGKGRRLMAKTEPLVNPFPEMEPLNENVLIPDFTNMLENNFGNQLEINFGDQLLNQDDLGLGNLLINQTEPNSGELLVGDTPLQLESLDSENLVKRPVTLAKPPKSLILDEVTQIPSQNIKKNIATWTNTIRRREVPFIGSHLHYTHLSVYQLFNSRPLALNTHNQLLMDPFPNDHEQRFCEEWDKQPDSGEDIKLDDLEAQSKNLVPTVVDDANVTKDKEAPPDVQDLGWQLRMDEQLQFDQNFPGGLGLLPQTEESLELELRRRASSINTARLDFGDGRQSILENRPGEQTERDYELVSEQASSAFKQHSHGDFLRLLHDRADNGVVNFFDLVPPATTSAANAALMFSLLLESIKTREIAYVVQELPYSDIRVHLS